MKAITGNEIRPPQMSEIYGFLLFRSAANMAALKHPPPLGSFQIRLERSENKIRQWNRF